MEKDWLFENIREIEKIKKVDHTHPFWQYRPTRVFWLASIPNFIKNKNISSYYTEEAERLKDAFCLNYYKNTPDFAKIALYDPEINDTLPCRGAYVPIVIENKHEYLPDVSFSGFEEASSDVIGKINLKKYEKISNALKSLLDYETNVFYILQIDYFFEIKGRSFELGYFVNRWLQMNKNTFRILPNICCTGEVSDNGAINEIDQVLLKTEAALTKDFDYIFLPEKNRKEIDASKHASDNRIIYFQNIHQVINFLSENTDEQKSKNKIRVWLNGDNSEPKDDFERHFKAQNNPIDNSIKIHKDLLGYKSTKEKYEKLQIMTKYYLNYALKNFNSSSIERAKAINLMFPRDTGFFYLTSLLKENSAGYNEKTLYNSTADFFLSSDTDVTIAAGLLSNTDFIEQNDIFKNIRLKYPKLLCLLFKNSAQLLYLLSCLKDMNYDENRLSQQVLNELENFDLLTNERKAEINMMNNVLSHFSGSVAINDIDLIPNAKKIEFLYRAYNNFLKQNKPKEAQVCVDYFDKILDITNETSENKPALLELFKGAGLTEQHNKLLEKSTYSNFKKTLNANNKTTKSYLEEIKSLETTAETLLNRFINGSFDLNEKPECFVQPAFNIFVHLYQNHDSKTLQQHLKEILDGFKNHYANTQSSEANALKAGCLSFWAGNNLDNFDAAMNLNLKKPYALTYYVGALKRYLTKNGNKCEHKEHCKLKKHINSQYTGNIHDFLWLYFLVNENAKDCKDTQNPCKDCIGPNLNLLINEKLDKYSKEPEKSHKTLLEQSFLSDLFNCKTNDNFWQKELIEYSEHPHETRRTTQLLAPISLLIKSGHSSDTTFEGKTASLNNSQFVTEYIRLFCTGTTTPESFFVPISWQSSIDKQMFDTIVLLCLKDHPTLLKNYVLSRIHDLPNLYLAFKLTDGDFPNIK